MGGKSSPDLGQLAIQQGEFDKAAVNQQTFANRPTQYSPWGYTSWNPSQVRDPATGEMVTSWEQTTGLTPELQDILNKQIAVQGGRTDIAGMLTGRLGNEYNQSVDWSTLSPLAATPQSQFTLPEGGIDNPYGTRQRAEDAMFNAAQSRLQPMYDSKRQALEIKLRNSGIGPEDEAWRSQMTDLGRQENDAYNQAIWSATGEGRQEAGQMFGQQLGLNQNTFNQSLASNQANYGQALQGANYANALRQQQMAEVMQQRGYGLNEINALLSGQQVGMPQMPSFTPAGAAAGAPIYQAGADQASVNAANNPWNALIGAAGTIGGGYATGLGMSG